MADEEKVVETEQTATVESTKEEVVEEVDYEKELEEVTRKVQAKSGYEMRHQKKEDEAQEPDDMADRVAAKLFPKLQAVNEQNLLNQRLEQLSKGNPTLKKLIQTHYDNSTNPNADMESRLDVAYAAANKKRIEKAVRELNVAQSNRSQIGSTAQGSSTEVLKKPGQNIVSDAQLQDIKSRAEKLGRQLGWNPATQEKFVADAVKSLASR